MRKTEEVRIAEGRDAGKVFLLTEMAASQAEAWAIRAMGAMIRGGQPIPDEVLGGGWAALSVLLAAGLRALLRAPWEEIEPLLAEMMGCVQIVPDPGNPTVMRRLIEDDILDVSTRLELREKVFSLHLGFSVAGALSALASAVKTDPNSLNTSTSPEVSEP